MPGLGLWIPEHSGQAHRLKWRLKLGGTPRKMAECPLLLL